MHRLILSLLLVVSFLLAGVTPGLAAGTLQGETLTGTLNDTSSGAWCGPPNTGSSGAPVYVSGISTGPYPGIFLERIRFDLANGIITSWNANFTIYDSTGVVKTVQGTESLPATTITATCSQVIGPYGIPAQHFVVIATVTYQATIYGTGGSITTDSGTSLTTLDFVLVPDFGYGNISIGTFTESFSPAGCNGTGGGQGNDSCSGQNGGNGQN